MGYLRELSTTAVILAPGACWWGGSEPQLMKSFWGRVPLRLPKRSWRALKSGTSQGPLWRPQIDGIRCKRGLAREVSPEGHFGACAMLRDLRDLWDRIDGIPVQKSPPRWSRRSPAGLVTPSARSSLWAAWRADLGPGDPGSWEPWDGLGVLGIWDALGVLGWSEILGDPGT